MARNEHDEDYARDVACLTWEGRKQLGIPEAVSAVHMPLDGSVQAIALEQALGFKPVFETKGAGFVFPWASISNPYITALSQYQEAVDSAARVERHGSDSEKLDATIRTSRASNQLAKVTRSCAIAAKVLVEHLETVGLIFQKPSKSEEDNSLEF
jgi:hypothetical protein